MSDHFNIVIVCPAGYQFSETFREVAETLQFGLRRLQNTAEITVNDVDESATNILLGAHLLVDGSHESLPKGTIIYNFEQVHGASNWIKPIYVDLIRQHTSWDYSLRNIRMWQRYCPDSRSVHVPLGYVAELSRIQRLDDEDIDVLFYGVINERRAEVLNKLQRAGLKVVAVTGQFGAARDALIARAKVVLNMHFFETKIFELPRVAYLLANRKTVVSEIHMDTEIDDELRSAVVGDLYENLVDRCIEYVFDDVLRQRISEMGFQVFSRRREEFILASALAASVSVQPVSDVALPKRLNVGSGKGWDLEALNLDVDPLWKPDFLADLNQPLPPGAPVNLGRFGIRNLPAGYFEEIHASHVLEHVANLVRAMESFLRLLCEGGILSVEVPYDLSHGAWQDPTHVRALNERSWLYYTEWFWYLGWTEHRFEVDELQYMLSEYGQQLATSGKAGEDLCRTPRAVDAIRVKLRKISLTEAEKLRVMQRWLG